VPAAFAAVTGMLRALVELRRRRVATRLVEFVWEEMRAERLLFLRSVWALVWAPMALSRGVARGDARSGSDRQNAIAVLS
jgi:hypothetical protein